MSDDGTLKVNVTDGVNTADIPHGGGEAAPMSREDAESIMAEHVRNMQRYVAPHNKKSRWVEEKDMPRLLDEALFMAKLGKFPRGAVGPAAALAHMQIDDQDPLRFFVELGRGMVFINPVLSGYSEETDTMEEGCMTFPSDAPKKVTRPKHATLRYQTLVAGPDGKPVMSDVITINVTGMMSRIAQHEIGHCNGVNIYDADFDPMKSFFLGDGEMTERAVNKLYYESKK